MQELGKSNHFFPFKSRIIHSKPQRALSRTQVLARARCRAPRDLPAPQHGREATGDPGTKQILPEVGMETREPGTAQGSPAGLCTPGWETLSMRTVLETWTEGQLPPQGQRVPEDRDIC